MKFYILVLLGLLSIGTYAQKKKRSAATEKCRLVYDKEINREVYLNTDTEPVFVNDTTDGMFWLADNFQFTPVSKVYKEDQRVKFAYVIEKDGHSSFIKLFYPEGDQEIEAQVKRIIPLIPLYKPATCGGEPVPTHAIITMRLYSKKRTD